MSDFDSSLPIRTETDGDVVAGIVDSGDVRIDPALKGTQTDGTQKTQIVSATGDAWDIDANGAGLIRWDVSDPIPVTIEDAMAGDEINVFATAVAGVPNTPVTVLTFTVNTGKILRLRIASASASGKVKIEVKAGTPASETVRAVRFIGTAQNNADALFPTPLEVVAGDNVLIVMTNTDKANQDLYANISGNEVNA